jgi:NADP-dependent 3-hydroxy acid dehydrogenase YdfG
MVSPSPRKIARLASIPVSQPSLLLSPSWHLNIACGQIDIGNAATTRNEDTARGRLQATGRVEAEPRMDVEHVARGVVYMTTLPLKANVQFVTVMATKMPISVTA